MKWDSKKYSRTRDYPSAANEGKPPTNLGLSHKLAEGLACRGERPALMNNFIKMPFEFYPPDRDFHEDSSGELVADGNAGQDRNTETGNQRLLHGLCAAEFHGYVQDVLGTAFMFSQECGE